MCYCLSRRPEGRRARCKPVHNPLSLLLPPARPCEAVAASAGAEDAEDEAPGPDLFLRTMLQPEAWAAYQRHVQVARAAATEQAALRTAEYRHWEVLLDSGPTAFHLAA